MVRTGTGSGSESLHGEPGPVPPIAGFQVLHTCDENPNHEFINRFERRIG
jgi:hypothetical protein